MRRPNPSDIGGIDRYTKLYLPMAGVSDSTIIPDKSLFAHPVTVNGNAAISTSVFKRNASSCSFDGTNSFISLDTCPITTGITDSVITVDFWAYWNADTDLDINMIPGSGTNYTQGGFTLYYTSGYGWLLGRFPGGDTNGNYARVNTAWTPTLNTWYHFAFVWNANGTANFYMNGIAIALNATTLSTGLSWGNAPIYHIGGEPGSYFNGYMSDLRISDGTDRGWTTPTIEIDYPDLSGTTGKDIVEYTKLWIPGYGANNATDIKDKSAFSRSVSNTDVIVSTIQSKFNRSSLYFNGSTSKLEIPVTTDWAFEGDFLVSLWFYPVTNPSPTRGVIIGNVKGSDWSDISWVITHETDGSMLFQASDNGSSGITLVASALSIDTWNNITVSREGATTSFYVNGSRVDTTSTSYTVLSFVSAPLMLGTGYNSGHIDGYLSDVVVINGSALNLTGATISVPTKPFSLRGVPQRSYTSAQYDGVANGIDQFTKLYLPLSEPGNAFTDKSFYEKAITNTDVVSSTSQSKFGGSSASFNGSSAYLSIPNSVEFQLNADNFVLSCWVYWTSVGTAVLLDRQGNAAPNFSWQWYYYNTTNALYFLYSLDGSARPQISFSWTPLANTWYHIVTARSGNTLRSFVNGSQIGSTETLTGTIADGNSDLYIGDEGAGGGNFLNGYMSDVLICKGTDLGYTGATIPVPTRPACVPNYIPPALLNTSVQSIANPALHIPGYSNTNNATVIEDKSPYARAITNTNCVLSTDNQKYGPSSIYFNGTSAKLEISDISTLELGSSDFVVSMWFYQTANTDDKALLSKYNAGTGRAPIMVVTEAGNYKVYFSYTGSAWDASIVIGTMTAAVWHHLVIARAGNTCRAYLNGVKASSDATLTSSLYDNTDAWLIGQHTSTYFWNGYISEFIMCIGTNLGYTGSAIPVPQGPTVFR